MNQLKTETMTALKVFLVFALVLGLVYPLMIMAIAQLTMPAKANGSLITIDGNIVGSTLIGQLFSSSRYFQSRPSAVDYNAAGSGGSNFGPSSQKLMDSVKERITQVRTINALQPDMTLPADMVLASASGLDPHISVQNALLQVSRIAKTRALSEDQLQQLIDQHTEQDLIGIWGQKRVNVLTVNLALDQLAKP